MKPLKLSGMVRCLVLSLAAMAPLFPTMAWGLGADHPNTPINNDKWPKGLAELVNAPNRVHGYFVNDVDILYFRGDAQALNAFLNDYAKLPNTQFRLVLHAGKPAVKSPWDKQPCEIAADWRLYAGRYEEGGVVPKSGQFVTRLEVWLGGSVKQDELRIPANISMKSADGVADGASAASTPRDEPTPSTRPAGKYRLTRQTVAGLAPMQWVFIIVTPEGYPWVATDDQLRSMIEKAVPAHATLEWISGCKRVGGEPLEKGEDLEALRAFCAERNVTFTHRAGF